MLICITIVWNLWCQQRPDLKNLTRGLNLTRCSNMVGSTWNCIKFFNIWAGNQLKPVLGGFETWLKFIKFGHCFFIFTIIFNCTPFIFIPYHNPLKDDIHSRILNIPWDRPITWFSGLILCEIPCISNFRAMVNSEFKLSYKVRGFFVVKLYKK